MAAPATVYSDTALLTYDHSWRYNQGGTNLPIDWKMPGYDDSAWPIGKGVFGVPANEPLPVAASILTSLNLSNGGAFTRTFFFRTEFVVTQDFSNSALVLSNVIDDGAIFYLNGREIGRIAMPASGVISNGTFATRIGEVTFDGVEVFMAGATNLVQGTNTLAVELHQWATDSSDAVFGMHLSLKSMPPPEIVRNLEDQTIFCPGRKVTFSVVAIGEGLSYSWYYNHSLLAKTPTFTLFPNSLSVFATGIVSVVISNINGTVSSRDAIITIYPDGCGPRVTQAAARGPVTNEVVIRFDEPLLPEQATNTSNYVVTQGTTGGPITVTNVLRAGNAALLKLGEYISYTNQYLVRDERAPRPLR